jgi:hypothetical protein
MNELSLTTEDLRTLSKALEKAARTAQGDDAFKAMYLWKKVDAVLVRRVVAGQP